MFPLYELFMVGGVIFWGVIAIAFCIALYAIEKENALWALITTIVTLMVIGSFTAFNPFAYAYDHRAELYQYVAYYFVGGGVYASVRWLLWAHNLRVSYRELRERWTKSGGATEWFDEVRYAFGFSTADELRVWGNPRIRNHKSTVMTWMTYWPICLPWTILNEPVKRTFVFIYNSIGGSLQWFSDRLFGDVSTDFKK